MKTLLPARIVFGLSLGMLGSGIDSMVLRIVFVLVCGICVLVIDEVREPS